MAIRIQNKRDTTANWVTNGAMVPLAGEICIDSTLGQFKIGDGATAYSALPYAAVVNPMTAAGDLIVGGVDGAMSVLPVDDDDKVLTLVSGAPAWAAPAAPSGTLDCGSSTV
jgi:hypothetical protein